MKTLKEFLNEESFDEDLDFARGHSYNKDKNFEMVNEMRDTFSYKKMIKIPNFDKTSSNKMGTTFFHYGNKKVHVVKSGPDYIAVVNSPDEKGIIHSNFSSLKRHLNGNTFSQIKNEK